MDFFLYSHFSRYLPKSLCVGCCLVWSFSAHLDYWAIHCNALVWARQHTPANVISIINDLGVLRNADVQTHFDMMVSSLSKVALLLFFVLYFNFSQTVTASFIVASCCFPNILTFMSFAMNVSFLHSHINAITRSAENMIFARLWCMLQAYYLVHDNLNKIFMNRLAVCNCWQSKTNSAIYRTLILELSCHLLNLHMKIDIKIRAKHNKERRFCKRA